MKYTYIVVFGKTPNNYAAFSPDIPGCVSTADTPEEMRRMIREAIEFHFDGLDMDGYPIPLPTAWVETAEVTADRKYLLVYERDPDNFVAYVPDFLPECEVTGGSVEEVQQNLRQAIAEYLSATVRNGGSAPEPSAWAEIMEIAHPSRVSA